MEDTRTEAEKIARYDALKDGSAYVKQERSPLYYLKQWIDSHYSAEPPAEIADQGLTDTEREILGLLVELSAPPTPPANPSPLLVDLVDWAEQQLKDEQPSPPIIVDVLETIERRFERQ